MENNTLSTPEYNNLSLFGRKWKVSILVPEDENLNDVQAINLEKYKAYIVSDSDWEDLSLRVTFHIKKYGFATPNYSEISVYNMNANLERLVIKNGMRIIVEAGYVNGSYGIIYNQPIYQPIWERENVTDFKVTFYCIDMDGLMGENWVAEVSERQNQKDRILSMASKSRKAIDINWDDNLENPVNSRRRIYFGHPRRYLRDIAIQNGTHLSVIDDQINIHTVQYESNPNIDAALILRPEEGGLIGTPQQTQDGITFTTLLNPAIKVFEKTQPMFVKIDNENIRQLKRTQGTVISRLDEDGIYKVAGVEHVGDTRGRTWYTNVIGFSQIGKMPVLFETQQGVSR